MNTNKQIPNSQRQFHPTNHIRKTKERETPSQVTLENMKTFELHIFIKLCILWNAEKWTGNWLMLFGDVKEWN